MALILAAVVLSRAAPGDGPGDAWQSALGREHPLTGRIWEIAAARFIEPPMLVEHVRRSRFILLGEKHDNPDHHRLQAWLVRALIAAGRRPAVAFEMLTTDDAPAIARHLAAAPTDAAGLAEAVHWSRSGWPDWALYQPIAEAALAARLPIVATNLPPATARLLSQQGVTGLEPALVARLGLNRPLAPEVHAELAAEIRETHCGHAPSERVEAMIAVQRARDAQMAESLAAVGREDGAVLIAGAGHVRTDRGIPAYLAASAPDATVSSLALLEVDAGATMPESYAPRFRRDTLPFDYVWFTPRLDDLDPCTTFGEQLKRLEQRR
jgi:uncharacterized iron-regulated protein